MRALCLADSPGDPGSARHSVAQRLDCREKQWIEGDRDEGAGQNEIVSSSTGRRPSAMPMVARMNENSPIWAAPAATAARAARSPSSRTSTRAASGFPTTMTQPRDRCARVGHQHGRIEQHPDRDEEQDGKGVAHRQRVVRGAEAEVGLGRRPCRPETRRAPSRRRRARPSRPRCPGRSPGLPE